MGGEGFESTVLPIRPGGPLEAAAESAGAEVVRVGRLDLGSPVGLLRLASLARKLRPDIVQGWLYLGNLASLAARSCAPDRAALVWNFRHTIVDPNDESFVTRLALPVLARYAPSADFIIHNSTAGLGSHHRLGLQGTREDVFPNGFDTREYRPDPEVRDAVRAQHGWGGQNIVVALVGRYHPMKGHDVLLSAAARVVSKVPDARFVLVGDGTDSANAELGRELNRGGFGSGVVSLLGRRTDIPEILCACDLLVAPSLWGEGFSNVIGEAMSCGVPCVGTDVGGTRDLIGDSGCIVSPGDVEQLSTALFAVDCDGAGGPNVARRAGADTDRAKVHD